MLQKLRDNSSGWIATVILGLLIIPFAFFGLEQYMVQRTNNYVAQIDAPPRGWQSAPSWWPVSVFWDHEQITSEEFRTSFEQARQQARVEQGEAFDARVFESADTKRAILEGLIDQRIQRMEARNSGVVVDDALMRRTIQQIPEFQVDGRPDPLADVQRHRHPDRAVLDRRVALLPDHSAVDHRQQVVVAAGMVACLHPILE